MMISGQRLPCTRGGCGLPPRSGTPSSTGEPSAQRSPAVQRRRGTRRRGINCDPRASIPTQPGGPAVLSGIAGQASEASVFVGRIPDVTNNDATRARQDLVKFLEDLRDLFDLLLHDRPEWFGYRHAALLPASAGVGSRSMRICLSAGGMRRPNRGRRAWMHKTQALDRLRRHAVLLRDPRVAPKDESGRRLGTRVESALSREGARRCSPRRRIWVDFDYRTVLLQSGRGQWRHRCCSATDWRTGASADRSPADAWFSSRASVRHLKLAKFASSGEEKCSAESGIDRPMARCMKSSIQPG
jgi:hypothetical protein